MRLLGILAFLPATTLAAQGRALPVTPVATITAEDIMRRVSLVAHDTMMGRNTPSRGLELTAAYVAEEFRRAGLRPAGDSGSYIQRFGLTRWLVDTTMSWLALSRGKTRSIARLGIDARYIDGVVPQEPIRGDLVVLGSSSTAREVADKIVMLVVDFSRPVGAALNRRVQDLASAGARAVLVLSNRDTATFADRLSLSGVPRLTRDSARTVAAPVFEVHERALGPVLAAAGVEVARIRRGAGGGAARLTGMQVEIRVERKVLARLRAPNVVGVLEGTDPVLRREYVAYSAHIDHIGITPGQPDSINNGADDNASGVAGLLELVEAFATPGERPRRSLIFLAPSAEEPGLLGSAHFTEHPPVPLESIVADINMDLIGRNWRDSVIAVGIEQSDLGETLDRVVRTHRELRMTPIADRWPEERIFYRSDHYNFARRGVPILFFTSGTHPDYHRPTDEPRLIDAEKETRLIRLLFYLGAEVANQKSRPRWHPDSYRQIVDRR